METKHCNGCGKDKPASEFGKNGTRLRSKCNTCISEYNRKWYIKEDYTQKEYSYRPVPSDPENLVCTKCDREQPRSEFYDQKNRRDGKFLWCKGCERIRAVIRYDSLDKKEALKQKRIWFLQKEYGITLEEYEQLEEEQNGLCAVCGKPNIRNHFLCVDHDHKTKRIRGLLCHRCNRSVGFAQDDPEILRKLADYIEQANKTQVILKSLGLVE
jgi:hypothetical protein